MPLDKDCRVHRHFLMRRRGKELVKDKQFIDGQQGIKISGFSGLHHLD